MEFQPYMLFPFLVALWAIAFAIRASGSQQQSPQTTYMEPDRVGRIYEVETIDPYEGVPAFQDQQRGFELNNIGFRDLESKNDEITALAQLEASAALGIPHALATLTWHHFLGGNCEEAERLFEKYWPKCGAFEYLLPDGSFLDGEAAQEARQAIANCASNGGLVYQCRGKPKLRDEVWNIALQAGSIEAHAYMLFTAKADSITQGLSHAETIELLTICSKAVREAKPGTFAHTWFLEINSALAK